MGIRDCFRLPKEEGKKTKGHGEEKVVETLALGSCPVGISRSPKIPIVFLSISRKMLSFLKQNPGERRTKSLWFTQIYWLWLANQKDSLILNSLFR